MIIVLVHNRETEPIMERSLRYVGVDNFVVLRPNGNRPWRNTVKLTMLKEYLDSGACKTKYLLLCDSDDAVLSDDPGKAIDYLEDQRCDLLFSSTKYTGGYVCMPHIKEWADQKARESGSAPTYINAGVFVGKTAFLRQVLEVANSYVTEHDLSRTDYRRLRREGSLNRRLPEFPRGIGCDQVILRYLHPRFYPQMKVDYAGQLALR
jgi:hypothetical protein